MTLAAKTVSPPSSSPPAEGRPPPSPKRYPLVGHLPWVLRAAGGTFRPMLNARAAFPEGLFRLTMPTGRTPVFVLSARLCAELCDETRFHKSIVGPLEFLRDAAADGLFTAHHGEPAWGTAHKLLVPGFAASAMGRFFPTMQRVADSLVEHWGGAADAGVDVDVSVDMTKLTLDTIALCGFDRDFDSFGSAELHPFLQALGRILAHTERRLRRPAFVDTLKRGEQRRYQADLQTMSSVVDEVIARRKVMPRADWPKDFLSLMLDDGSGGSPLTDENIRAQVITFLIAGHETTSALLSFALFHLLQSPDDLARVRAEADAAFDADGDDSDGGATLKGVLDLSHTRRVLSEALRLYPPAMAFQVTPHAPTVLDGQWAVKPGDPLVVILPAVHRDPEAWERPDTFWPDRFLKENEAKRPPNAYKPFGNGKRACIGKQFALIEATLALARVVHSFDLDGDDNRARNADLKLLETLTIKPADFRLRPRRRQR